MHNIDIKFYFMANRSCFTEHEIKWLTDRVVEDLGVDFSVEFTDSFYEPYEWLTCNVNGGDGVETEIDKIIVDEIIRTVNDFVSQKVLTIFMHKFEIDYRKK